MPLNRKAQARIEAATRRFVAYLRYRAAGPHTLTKDELTDLVRSGLIRPGRPPKNAVSRAYLQTYGKVANLPPPVASRDKALGFLERMFSRYAKKAAEGLTTDVLNSIEGNLAPFALQSEGKAVYELLKDLKMRGKYLGNALRNQVKNWSNRWKTIVDTELTRAANYGAADAIVANNKADDKGPAEITVCKIGNKPGGGACPDCVKFWFNVDGTPRAYRLSDLHGTNIGVKRADWQPTLDSTHPHCTHEVIEIRPGFGFRAGTSLDYIGKGPDGKLHDEYAAQKARFGR